MQWLSPATREKFRRFRKLRRAWVSLCLLAIIFILSLLSELIANDTPWLLKYDGRLYFPRVQEMAQDLFYGNEVQSAPDYHLLKELAAFEKGSGNWMAWAPIRYRPENTIAPDRIVLPDQVLVERNRAQRVSELRINSKGRLKVGRGGEWFFPEGEPQVPQELAQVLEPRFENKPMPAFEIKDASDRFMWSLSAYDPLSRNPRTQRILLRELLAAGSAPVTFTILAEDSSRPDWWPANEEAEAKLIESRTVPVEAFSYMDEEGVAWEISFNRETVQFPFRPVKNHPLGLDQSGRDVLVIIVYATRISLLFGFILVFFSMLMGTLMGGLQGYFGGTVDLITQRIIEIYGAIPFLYAMIYLGSVFGRSFGLLLFVYAIFNWIGISYYMRAEFYKLRKQPFIEAAHSLGLPTGRIMWKHILPNALVPLITFFPFSLVGAIGSLSALDYIGFGLPVGTPSWGDLLSQAQTYRYAWWLIVYPALTLFIIILLGVFIGEGLRNAFDPKRETHWEA